MRLKVLGGAGGIGGLRRTTALQIDHDILLDAGTGVGDLDNADMEKIDHIFLTHVHVDHTAFLPLLIDANFSIRVTPMSIYATEDAIAVLKDHVFNWHMWPDFTQLPSPDKPVLRFVTIEVGQVVRLGDRQVTAVPANHTVPTVGYHLDSGAGSLVFRAIRRGAIPFGQ